MAKKTKRLGGDGTSSYAVDGDRLSYASGRKLRRLKKHKPHLFEEQNNVALFRSDEEGNVYKQEGTNDRGKSTIKKFIKNKRNQIENIDHIWFEWVEEAVHIIGRDLLLSIRNLAIIGTIIAIIGSLV